MNPPPARSNARKLTAAATGAVLLLAVSAIVWIQAVAARRTKEMGRQIDALVEESRAVDASRPVLRGTAVPGNAWEEYSKALGQVSTYKGDFQLITQFLDGKVPTDREAVVRIVRNRSDLVDLLRAGTRRASAAYPDQWWNPNDFVTPDMVRGCWLGNLAVVSAKILADEGKGREAAELLLDVGRFGGDFGHNSIMLVRWIGSGIRSQAIRHLRDLVVSGKLAPEDFREVDRELEILDRDSPLDRPYYRNQVIMAGFLLRMPPGERDKEYQSDWWQRWRYGFSDEIMAADAFERIREAYRLRGEGEGKSYSEARAATANFDAASADDRNPLAKAILWPPDDPTHYVRECLAQLRLLRITVRYRSMGEILDLDDPYGGKLFHQAKDGRLKIWSVGSDGVDDGGSGGWTRKDGTDIVLEVPK